MLRTAIVITEGAACVCFAMGFVIVLAGMCAWIVGGAVVGAFLKRSEA